MLTSDDLDRFEAEAGFCAPLHHEVAELVKMARLGLLCQEKLTSGNSVPVERITIKREEFEAINSQRKEGGEG